MLPETWKNFKGLSIPSAPAVWGQGKVKDITMASLRFGTECITHFVELWFGNCSKLPVHSRCVFRFGTECITHFVELWFGNCSKLPVHSRCVFRFGTECITHFVELRFGNCSNLPCTAGACSVVKIAPTQPLQMLEYIIQTSTNMVLCVVVVVY